MMNASVGAEHRGNASSILRKCLSRVQQLIGSSQVQSTNTREGSTTVMGHRKRALTTPSPETNTFPIGLWTIDDVCRYLQFGRTTIFGFMKQRHHPLPAIRIGPSIRFKKADIDRWIERWRECGA